jgi:hypothetical protein
LSFEFTRDGVTYRFHTEVGGEESTRCVLEEQSPEQPVGLEPEDAK